LIKNSFKAHLALLGANIIYGVNHIVAKGVMPDKIGPSAFVFLRILFAGILFWIIKLFIKEKVAVKDLYRLMLCGLLGVASNMLLFFHGLSMTSPIDASIIMTSGPVMVLIFSRILLKEKITPLKILGIVIGAFGAILLIWYGERLSGTSSLLGNLFVFINACSYALYLVLVKPLMKKYHPITVISWVFLFGFCFMFLFGINDVLTTNFYAFTTNTYLTIIFVIVGTTFLAYLFNIYALNHVSPSISSSYIYLQPAISFIMVSIYTYALNQKQYAEDINIVKILSCILVIGGVFLISKNPAKKLV
jgi:drug/metabolite transporter (DMT)-like permease